MIFLKNALRAVLPLAQTPKFLAVPELEASQDKGLHPNGLVWQPAVSCGQTSLTLC